MQYILWLKNILTGNFGYSLQNHRPVLDLIVERLPATIGLMGSSLLVSFVNCNLSSLYFCGNLRSINLLVLFKVIQVCMRTVGQDSFLDIVQHGILPCMVLAFQNVSVYMRYIRSSTIQQLEEDYVQIQYAYGASKKTVLFNHVLRNVLIPIITIFGLSIPSLVGGAFITETVFSLPGLGSLGVNAIFRFDYPIIMAITLLSSFMLILGNLIADILYGVVDPRIRMRGDLE